jgi:hypothetical protein
MNWAFPDVSVIGYKALIDEMPMIRRYKAAACVRSALSADDASRLSVHR